MNFQESQQLVASGDLGAKAHLPSAHAATEVFAHADKDQRRIDEYRSDVRAAWAALPEASILATAAQRSLVVTMDRSNSAYASFDVLRTNVLQEARKNRWTSIGITSPTPGCGTSLVALNLAFSLQHHNDKRTILLDLDLRRPRLAELLCASGGRSVTELLSGSTGAEKVLARYGTNLALGFNDVRVEFSAELLQSASAAAGLAWMREKYAPDVVLCDLPPALASDDVAAFADNLDCVLIVARAERSRIDEIDACERFLAERTNVLGVVLNDCRYLPEKFGY